MSETLQRAESLQPLHELANGLVQEMGEQPQERLEWLMQQTGESFGNRLLHLNSTVRGLNHEAHDFDGDGVQAGTVGGSIPPDQEDKVTLLGELMESTQQHISRQLENGEDSQAIMTEVAVAIPTVVNKLHLFADGNGRTSRMLSMVLRDGDQITAEKVDTLVNKKSIEKYDTTPGGPIETSIMRYVRSINGAGDLSVTDDVVDEDTFADEVHEDIRRAFPNIDPITIKAYSDPSNFNETVRLIGKAEGVTGSVSLKELFGKISEDPDELAKFKATYRGVRKQRVELLINGLLGEEPVPLSGRDKDRDVKNWFNSQRERNGIAPIDPDKIQTIQDFQMAYTETFSPQRTAA